MPKNKHRLFATAFSAAAALLLTSCGQGQAPDADGNGSATTKYIAHYAEDAAVGPQDLAGAIAPFFEDKALSETRALLIMHQGKLIAERYAPGYGPDSKLISWSMAKTVTATLAGLMVAEGRLSLDAPAPIAEWHGSNDGRRHITLHHLLNMASGLDHTEGLEPGNPNPIFKADTPRMLFLDGRGDVARYAETRVLEAPPGTKFEYSSATSHIIADIITRTLTDSKDPAVRRNAMLEYARGRLFEPLGMTSMTPEFDRSGTMLGGSIIHATARDWAKMGEFLRNNGSVNGAQLIPTSWIRFMRTSSEKDAAYGGHLWLNKPRPDGRQQVLFPGDAPDDVFAMLGHLGQYVVVSPQNGLVIVRLGKSADGTLAPVDDQLARLINLFPKRGRK